MTGYDYNDNYFRSKEIPGVNTGNLSKMDYLIALRLMDAVSKGEIFLNTEEEWKEAESSQVLEQAELK